MSTEFSQRALPLTVSQIDGEGAASVFQRIAARNGYADPADLSSAVGLSSDRLSRGFEAEVNAVAKLAGICPTALARWTFMTESQTQFRLGGEEFSILRFKRMSDWFCPLCLLQDKEIDPEWGGAHRTFWNVVYMRACPDHDVLLVSARMRNDVCMHSNIHRFVREVDLSSFELEAVEPSGLERYFCDRLAGTHDQDLWINQLQLGVVCDLCEIVGSILLHGPDRSPKTLEDRELRECGRVGFEYAKDGPAGLYDAFDLISSRFRDASHSSFFTLYSPLHFWLASASSGPKVDPIRQIVRPYAAGAFPLSHIARLFGAELPRVETVNTRRAAREYKIGHTALIRQLELQGDIEVGLDPNLQTGVVSHSRVDYAASVIRSLVPLREAAKVLGVSRQARDQFLAEGSLKLHFPAGGQKCVHRDSLFTLLARLQKVRYTEDQIPSDAIKLPEVAQRTHLSMSALLKAAEKRKISLIGKEHGANFAQTYVLEDTLKEFEISQRKDLMASADVAKVLRCAPRTVRLMAEEGYLEFHRMSTATTNRPCIYFDPREVQRFKQKYILLRPSRGMRRHKFHEATTYLEECGLLPLPITEGELQFFKLKEVQGVSANDPTGLLNRNLSENDVQGAGETDV